MSENNDYIQLPPLKKDTPSDVVAFMWEYMKVPEDSREKVKNIKKYLLAALFNAPSTMNGYYQAEVNHDMPGLVR